MYCKHTVKDNNAVWSTLYLYEGWDVNTFIIIIINSNFVLIVMIFFLQ